MCFKERGFTLIEVIFVIASLGVLAIIVIGNVMEGGKKARDTQRISDLGQIQIALRLYRDAYSTYPTNQDSGVAIGEGGALDDLISPYLTAVPRDVSGGRDDSTYEYVYDSSVVCNGTARKVLYAKTMEREGTGNWDSVCEGTSAPGSNTYVVILQ